MTAPGLTIIVDDDPMDRYLARRHLGRRSEFGEIVEVESGLDFLAAYVETGALAAARTRPALVLMDINMPGLDGFETAQAMQERLGAAGANPVIMMFTSSDNPDDRARADRLACVKGYIVKPLGDRDIAALLRLRTGG